MRPPADNPFNRWDVLKLLALALMTIDHGATLAGANALLCHALGRGAAPIFLFLIGYAGGRRIGPGLLVGAAALAALDFYLTRSPLNLNMLVTILLAKLTMQRAEAGRLRTDKPWHWFFALAALWPSYLLFAYGSIGLLIAFSGFMHRHRERFTAQDRRGIMMLTLLLYGAFEAAWFAFSPREILLMAVTLSAVGLLLTRFRNVPVAAAHALGTPLKTVARASLWLYALQYAALRLL